MTEFLVWKEGVWVPEPNFEHRELGWATLIGVLARDRPEGFEACLRGIERAGKEFRVVIHLDEPEPEVEELAHASGHEVLVSREHVGIGIGLNKILALREPDEHFCRLDGDTEVLTEHWLNKMREEFRRWDVLSAVLKMWDGRWSRELEPGYRTVYHMSGRGEGSVMLVHADVMTALGGFRVNKTFAFEDSDFYKRVLMLRARAGVNTRVVSAEAAPPNRKMWRHGEGEPDLDYVALRDAYWEEVPPVHRELVV